MSNNSYHGAALSFTNHMSIENEGTPGESITFDPDDKSTPSLPDYYVKIDPCELPTGDIYVHPCESKIPPALNFYAYFLWFIQFFFSFLHIKLVLGF